MRSNTIIAIAAVGALMIGAFMLFASSELIGSMHPDPHDRSCDYAVTGESESGSITGSATCTTLKENLSFYNYRIDIRAGAADGTSLDRSFVIIFDHDEDPEFFVQDESDGTDDKVRRYIRQAEGMTYRISVSDYCLIKSFSISSDEWSMNGILSE